MSRETSMGGAATNRGIWYQALWCVLCAVSARIERTDGASQGNPDSLRLVLEPHGGDTWLERTGGRRVVQLKALAEGTWSLKSLVEKILPDLYRAVSLDLQMDTTYEFLTEGGIGQWLSVGKFFESLARRIAEDASETDFQEAYERLNDTTPLKFGGARGGFWDGHCTERKLFDRIVDHLRTESPAIGETIGLTRRKTWRLLSRFHFEGRVKESEVRRDIHAALLPVIDQREDIPEVLNAMVGWMIDRSSANETTVTPEELFQAHGLKYVLSVSQWAKTKQRCREQCQRHAELRGYRPDWDVRLSQIDREVDSAHASIVVVSGESGFGKSWSLYAQSCAANALATVILECTGDAETDLQRSANRVWREALGHEKELTLQQLANRCADVLGRPVREPWLRICLDRLTSAREARDLLHTSIEDWGVQLVIGCDERLEDVFDAHQRELQDRVQLIRLDRFSPTERDRYLGYRLGNEWARLPADVRELLRKPQLAGLYCELSEDLGGWQPRNEYELLERFWRRLTAGENARHRRDALRLGRLAAMVLEDARYPWDDGQLDHAEITDSAAWRMTCSGWLRSCPSEHFEVPHIRLLNFAVAKGLINRHRDGSMADNDVAVLLRRILNGNARFGGVRLDYVPLDWFFLRLKDDGVVAGRVLALVEDGLQHHTREVLHQELLPTLGSAAVPLLVELLTTLAVAGKWHEITPVIEGLSTRPTEELREFILGLLADDRPRVRRAALMLLARRPMPEVLDDVWQLHMEMQDDPQPFFGDDGTSDNSSRRWLYRDSFDALRECSRLAPNWVATTIRQADPEIQPVCDLAYLTANLSDQGETWRSCKVELFKKVPSDKRRALATNIGIWRDNSELARLEEWVGVEEDLLGSAALRALALIDPSRGAAQLAKLPLESQYFCRHWHLRRLLLTAPSETRNQLRQLIQESVDPLRAALVYQGNENEMDAATLNILLDRLDDSLRAILDERSSGDGVNESRHDRDGDAMYLPMKMLASIGRRDLLKTFEARQGTSLEDHLEGLLTTIIGPRCSLGQDNLTRDSAVNILCKIGGEGHGRVTRAFPEVGTQYGKLDAIKESFKNADEETSRLLLQIAHSDELWDDAPILQMRSMSALAAAGDGSGVLSCALKLGLGVPADIVDWLRPGTQPTVREIEEAVRVVREPDVTRLSGALIGLGLFGRVEAIGDMITVLRNPPDSSARVAAIVGLGRLGDPAESAVDLIGKCVENAEIRHVAVVALSRIGTSSARRRLLQSLRDLWDTSLAVWLTQFTDERAETVEMLTNRLESTNERSIGHLRDDLSVVLAQAGDDVLGDVLRCLPAVSDRIREVAFSSEGSCWFVGSKADAIRGLSAIDRDAAYLATVEALENADAHDRQLYPPILSRFNPEAARETFVGLATTEKHKAVLWAMAHTMRPEDVPWLLGQLTAATTSVRFAATRLAAISGSVDARVRNRLLEMLADPDERVASAAEESLHRIREHEYAGALAEELDRHGNSEGLKPWAFIDAALSLCDSGYEGTQWPTWAKKCSESRAFKMQPALGVVFQKGLSEKREKSLQDAERTASKRAP